MNGGQAWGTIESGVGIKSGGGGEGGQKLGSKGKWSEK